MKLLRMLLGGIKVWDGSLSIPNHKDSICGDTIADLRTRNNTLSVWKADTEDEINAAITALALSRDSVQKMVCLLLDSNDLSDIDIQLDETLGDSCGLDEILLKNHRDMKDIDFWKLGFLAEYMMKQTKDKTNIKNITKDQVTSLLNKYKNDGLIHTDLMKPKLKDNLKW